MATPKFRLTVPQSLFDAIASKVNQEFADSYLTGASITGTVIVPRTLTGYHKMMDRWDFREALKEMGLSCAKPTPFPGDGDRLSAKELLW